MPRFAFAVLVLAWAACSEDVVLGHDGDTGQASLGSGSSTSGGVTPTSSDSASPTTVDDGDGASATSDDDSGGLDGPKFDAAIPDGGTSSSDCVEEEANYIYVLADEAPPLDGTQGEMSLFRFRVDTLAFEQAAPIGEDCHLEGALVYTQSFGVDRNARAYMSGSGAMLTVDLASANPTCEYLSDPVPPFGYASLSYVSVDPDDPWNEVLYMHEVELGYGSLDPVADPPHFTAILPGYTGLPSPMPLAGTSDGRLFAIEPGTADKGDPTAIHGLVELDRATGMVVTELGDIEGTGPVAPYIAFYGGDIFVFDSNFAEDPLDISPTVRRFDLDDDDGDGDHELEVLVEYGDQPAPFFIRGVASPTCLPLTPEG
jgi:hypothetical protein